MHVPRSSSTTPAASSAPCLCFPPVPHDVDDNDDQEEENCESTAESTVDDGRRVLGSTPAADLSHPHSQPRQRAGSHRRPSRLLCPHCTSRGLRDAWEARRNAQLRLKSVEEETLVRLQQLQSSPHVVLAQLQDKSQRCREDLQRLQHQATHLAYQVAHGATELQAAQERAQNSQLALHRPSMALQHLHNVYISGSLAPALHEAQCQALRLRYAWAYQALKLHRISVGMEAIQLQTDRIQLAQGRLKQARGVGKIAGLPLPHAGPELFGVLPTVELQSALRLVASVVNLTSRCLKISLPHPLHLTMHPPGDDSTNRRSIPSDDIVPAGTGHTLDGTMPGAGSLSRAPSAASDSTLATPGPPKGNYSAQDVADFLASSTASLASLWRRGGGTSSTTPSPAAAAAGSESLLSRAARTVTGVGASMSTPVVWKDDTTQRTARTISASAAAASPLSTDPRLVQQRLQHARWAVVAEDSSPQSSRYALAPAASKTTTTTSTSPAEAGTTISTATNDDEAEERFAIALQLLQDDLIVLCIRAGVPVDRLWPAEALLLNLHELQLHCHIQAAIAASSASASKSAPSALPSGTALRSLAENHARHENTSAALSD